MIKEDLIRMVNDINNLCNVVEQETAQIKKQKREETKKLFDEFRSEINQYQDIMRKAGLREFSYPTKYLGHTYGLRVYLVIPGSYESCSFCEPGRIERWARSCGLSREMVVKWWFEDLDRAAFDEAFQNAIVKAINEKVENVIKENEEVKR